MSELKRSIESLREKLYLLLFNKELTDIDVVTCSQELDSLIVLYEKENKLTALK